MKKRILLLWAVLAASNLWLYLRVLRPLRRLAQKADQLAQGDFSALAQPEPGAPEIDAIRSAMNAMVRHVRRAQMQERTYSQALTNGQEAERARIAHELHDETTQSLIAIAQSLEIAQGLLEPGSPAFVLLTTTRQQAVETVHSLRRLIADLRPPMLDELGLIPALRMLTESSQPIAVSMTIDGKVRRLNEPLELALFRSAQEALLNAQRYSNATQIRVEITFQADKIRLTVDDNGCGFTPPIRFESFSATGHYGLIGIDERVKQLNGTFTISSRSQQGTQLVIELPGVATQQPDGTVRDPVCSTLIAPQQAYASTVYAGQCYYFCCPVCQGAFQNAPQVYMTQPLHE